MVSSRNQYFKLVLVQRAESARCTSVLHERNTFGMALAPTRWFLVESRREREKCVTDPVVCVYATHECITCVACLGVGLCAHDCNYAISSAVLSTERDGPPTAPPVSFIAVLRVSVADRHHAGHLSVCSRCISVSTNLSSSLNRHH